MSRHETKRVKVPGDGHADIDVQMVPLIKALWAAGYTTIGSCQDAGESAGRNSARYGAFWAGYALIEMPEEDALRLLDAVKETPQFRGRMHWAGDGAWNVSVPVLPFGWQGTAAVSPWAQVRFPASQVSDLVNVLAGEP